MDKSLAQSTISKSKPVSSSLESEYDCDKKCKTETIKSVHFQNIGFGYSEKFSNWKDKDWILTLAFLVDMRVCDHQRWQKMLVKLWVKNNIFNILGVKEDQCNKFF